MDKKLISLAEMTLEYAQRSGAQQAAVQLGRAHFIEVKRREGRLETLQSSTSCGLSVALYVDGRYSSNGTNLLEEAELKRFVEETVAMTRVLAPDPFRSLPDPSLYGPTPGVDLQLDDATYDQINMDTRLERVAAVEDGARATGGADVLSVTSELTTQRGEYLQIHSNGFRGEKRGTTCYLGATVSVRDEEERRPEDHWWTAARYFKELPAPASIGAEAARRALSRQRSRKMESKRLTMIVENRACGRLISSLLEPLGGAALQQKRSCFEDKIGALITSPLLNIVDEPLIVRGLGSRTFDEEGLAAHRLPVIEQGQLSHYFIDVYYGRKLGCAPTTGHTSNLLLTPGSASLADLIASVEEGVLVSSFLGGNANSATGDFSFGITGRALRRGQLAEPVSEMNITGSHLTFWRQLSAIGNDPYPYSSMRLPSLLFTDVQFSGA